MSADNFLALRLHEPSGKYVVTHESMSADDLTDLDMEFERISKRRIDFKSYLSGIFDTWAEAYHFVDECYAADEDGYCYIEYGPSIIAEQPKWENNNVQFARLLAEIMATQDNLDMDALADSMDLAVVEVEELFDRAQATWERIKDELG